LGWSFFQYFSSRSRVLLFRLAFPPFCSLVVFPCFAARERFLPVLFFAWKAASSLFPAPPLRPFDRRPDDSYQAWVVPALLPTPPPTQISFFPPLRGFYSSFFPEPTPFVLLNDPYGNRHFFYVVGLLCESPPPPFPPATPCTTLTLAKDVFPWLSLGPLLARADVSFSSPFASFFDSFVVSYVTAHPSFKLGLDKGILFFSPSGC